MKNNLVVLCCLMSLVLFISCDKKTENVGKVSTVACQDIKDEVEAYSGTLGKLALSLLVKDEVKNGAMCDCLIPIVKKELQEKTEAELEKMLIDKPMRGKAIKNALAKNMQEIFACYESKGLKGVGFLKKFLENLIKK